MSENEDFEDEQQEDKLEGELEDQEKTENLRDTIEDQNEDRQNEEAYQQGLQQQGIYPTMPEKQNVFTFFKKVIEMEDSSKVANLGQSEIGLPNVSVRGWQEIASFLNTMNMTEAGAFAMLQGEITLATSLSKGGFLDTLAISQKREITRKKDSPSDGKKPWTAFGRKAKE